MKLFEEIKAVMDQEGTPEEKEAWFEERTRKHISLVQQAAHMIAEAYPELKEVVEKAKEHDASKFKEPERTPYIEISWRHKFDNYGSYKRPGTLSKEDENKATVTHITTNQHHPEFWLEDKSLANIDPKDRNKSKTCIDATKMPPLAIAEMVADWQAMSWELGTNSAREWYNKQKDVRWHLSEEQDKLISKLLEVFENDKRASKTDKE